VSNAPLPSAELPAAPIDSDRLRLDYQQTTDLLRALTDARFKLLALVPTLSGAAVALLAHPGSAIQLLALGLLGLTATLGVLLYELRNTQLHDYALQRAQRIEAGLGFGRVDDARGSGGLFTEQPARTLRLFGLFAVDRDGGFALVYSAAMAGWSYLFSWGALRAAHVGGARPVGAAIGCAIGLILLFELIHVRQRTRARADSF
jgi:hypothetical protein